MEYKVTHLAIKAGIGSVVTGIKEGCLNRVEFKLVRIVD